MVRGMIALALTAGMLLALSISALAANPHFVVDPVFTDLGDTVNVTGSVAGLGNEDITVVVDAVGTATLICTNPGGNVAPGQTQQISASGVQENIHVENGRANFNVTTDPPQLVGTPRELGCPNNKWTPSITDVDFTSATLTVYQGGVAVLTETFLL